MKPCYNFPGYRMECPGSERRGRVNIIICDDDLTYLDKLKDHVSLWKSNNHREEARILTFHSSEDLLAQWDRGLKADILFLDILFESEMNGLDLAWAIRQRDEKVMIVFITNSEAYAKEGYAVHAFRYLSKPICYADLALCLDVAYRQFTLSHNEYFILNGAGRRTVIRYDQISYIEACSPYIEIHTIRDSSEDIVRIRGTFSLLEGKLPEELFVQCHRSYIVNILNIQSIHRDTVYLSTKKKIPISRSRFQVLCDTFDRYYQGGGTYHVDDH